MLGFFDDIADVKKAVGTQGDDSVAIGMPFVTITSASGKPELAAVVPANVSDADGAPVVIYLGYNQNGYFFESQNEFLGGGMGVKQARDTVKSAISDSNAQGLTIKWVMAGHNTHENLAFIANDDSNNDEFVGFCADVLASLGDERFSAISGKFNDHVVLKPKSNGQALKPILDLINRYAFKKSCIIEGDPGSGKTRLLHLFGKDFKFHFFQGHQGVESMDVIGYMAPHYDENGNEFKVWKDGPLTAAMRDASKGIKSILAADELLRVPDRERSAFTSCLAPDPDGYYTLVTDRIIEVADGVAKTEVIKAHKSKLFVLGTTNIGAEYDIDAVEPAFGERFRFVRLDTTEDMVLDALDSLCGEHELSDKTQTNLFEFYKGLAKLKSQEKINRKPSIRHLVDIIEIAGCDEDIKSEAEQSMSMWCGRGLDGRLIEDEVKFVQMLIDDTL